MDNGIYIAVARQMALFRDMDVTASNIANLDTSGYQSEHMMFEKYLVNDLAGSNMNFANDSATYRDTTQGSLRVTDNTLDLAIKGDGYFAVSTPLGQRYTRAGNFRLNDAGALVTHEGFQVLDTNGNPIVFESTTGEVIVGSGGEITVDGTALTTVGVMKFDNPALMERHGAQLYSSEATPTLSTNSEVVQGALETSNVNGIEQLTHMMKVKRGTSSTAKYIEVMYDLQRRTTNAWTQQR